MEIMKCSRKVVRVVRLENTETGAGRSLVRSFEKCFIANFTLPTESAHIILTGHKPDQVVVEVVARLAIRPFVSFVIVVGCTHLPNFWPRFCNRAGSNRNRRSAVNAVCQ